MSPKTTSNRARRGRALLASILALIVLALSGCGRAGKPVRREPAPAPAAAEAAAEESEKDAEEKQP